MDHKLSYLTDPWNWWVTPFLDHQDLRRALAASLLVVLATSIVGVWVVLRGMAFFGDALAHGVLPGIALAFVFGGNTTVGAAIAAVVMIGGISVVRSHSPLPSDVSIGVLFVGMLALAVVIMSSQTGTDAEDLDRFLFGSVATISNSDLLKQLIVAAVAVVGVIVLHRALMVLTFEEESAGLVGFHPKLTHAALLSLVALAVIASFETVGSLLVFAFLVAPPAAATLVAKRVHQIMLASVVIGGVAVVVGLAVSYHADYEPPATMALTTVVLFFVVLLAKSLVTTLRARRLEMVS